MWQRDVLLFVIVLACSVGWLVRGPREPRPNDVAASAKGGCGQPIRLRAALR